jgi:recombination protein RecT
MAGTALAVFEKELGAAKARMAMLVPKSQQKQYDVTKQVMQFAIEASKNPALLECSPTTVKIAMYHAASLGLEVGSVLGHAYLVPYGKTCQLIPGYRGLIYAAVRSGACRQIWAETIHENDVFSVRLGTDPKIEHMPPLGNRGATIGAYAAARMHGGGTQFVVLDIDEIERIRAASRSGKSGPWAQWFDEMAKKSAIRRLVKQLPVSTDDQRGTFLRTVAVDGEIDGGATPDQVSATLGIDAEKTELDAPKAVDVLDAAITGEPSHAELDREIEKEQQQ